MTDLVVGIRLKADGSGFAGDVRIAQAELAKLGRGGQDASRSLDTTARSTERLTQTLRTFGGAVAAAFAGREIIQFGASLARTADEMSGLNARLRLVSSSAAEYSRVQAELFQLAQRNLTPLADTVTLYTRIASGLESIGRGTAEAVPLTEAVSRALRLSGASATEAGAAMLQFSQGLASGVLRGDEFNSMMENAPRLARALADGLGVTVGQLRGMAAQGELTSEVIVRALTTQFDKLREESATLPKTIGGAFEQLRNEWKRYISDADQASGASKSIAEAISTVASNVGTLASAVGELLKLGLFAAGGALLGQAAAGFAALAAGVRATAVAVGALNAEMVLFAGGAGLARLTTLIANMSLASRGGLLGIALYGGYEAGKFLSETQAGIAALDGMFSRLESVAGKLGQLPSQEAQRVDRRLDQLVASGITSGDEFAQLVNRRAQLRISGNAVSIPRVSLGGATGASISGGSAPEVQRDLTQSELNKLAEAEKRFYDTIDDMQSEVAEKAQQLYDKQSEAFTRSIDDRLKAKTEEVRNLQRAERELAQFQIDEQARAAKEARELLERETERKRELLEQPFKNALTNIQSAFSGAFESLFNGGVDSFSDLASTIKNIFVRLAAEIAALLVFRPVVSSVLGAAGLSGISSALGLSGSSGSSGGLLSSVLGGGSPLGGFNPLSSLGGIGNAVNAFGSTIGFGGGGSVMNAAGFLETLPGSSAITSASLTSVLGAAGLGAFGGGMISNLIGGNKTAGSILGGAGAGIGFALGGPIGGIIGSVAGGLLSKLFGGGIPRQIAGATIDLSTGGVVTGGKNADPAQATTIAQAVQATLKQFATAVGGSAAGTFSVQTFGNAKEFGKNPFGINYGYQYSSAEQLAQQAPVELLRTGQVIVQGLDDTLKRVLDRSLAATSDLNQVASDVQFAQQILGLGASKSKQALASLSDQFDAMRERALALGLSIEEINRAQGDALRDMEKQS
ncbi:MAG: tape measure protein, partial [Vicinamibacterales bacterium]